MQGWCGRWLKGRGWQKSLDEIRRFLDTWYFYISDSGFLYVRPLHHDITNRQVHAFLRRLDILGKDRLPVAIFFDFRMVKMSSRRWCHIARTLDKYAAHAGSESLVILKAPPVEMTESIPSSAVLSHA